MRALGLFTVLAVSGLALTGCADLLGAEFDDVDACHQPGELRCGRERLVTICSDGHRTPLFDCADGSHCEGNPEPACVPDKIDCKHAKGRSICVGNARVECDDDGRVSSVEDCHGACADHGPSSPAECLAVQRLALGGGHTCTLVSDGTVRCFGSNFSGELGTPTGFGEAKAQAMQTVPLPERATDIAAGSNFSCALTETGRVFCWGRISSTTVIWDEPTEISGLVDVVSIRASGSRACILDGANHVFCWGDNESGQLCWPVTGPLEKPQHIFDLDGTEDLFLGPHDSCARFPDGSAVCCGAHDYGYDASLPLFNPAPRPVEGIGAIASVSPGEHDACALTQDGAVYCWGKNAFGAACVGDTSDHSTPTLALFQDSKQVVAAYGTLSLTKTGRVECCGNSCGDPHVPTVNTTPVPILAGAVDALEGGQGHACAVVARWLVCWGGNSYGQVSTTDAPNAIGRPIAAPW